MAVNVDISNSPTFTHMPTQEGLILGMAPYMSPEQVLQENIGMIDNLP